MTSPGTAALETAAAQAPEAAPKFSPEVVATHRAFVAHKCSFDVAAAALPELLTTHASARSFGTFTKICQNIAFSRAELELMKRTQHALGDAGAPVHHLDAHIERREAKLLEGTRLAQKLGEILHPDTVRVSAEAMVTETLAAYTKSFATGGRGVARHLEKVAAHMSDCIDPSSGFLIPERIIAAKERLEKQPEIQLKDGGPRIFTLNDKIEIAKLLVALAHRAETVIAEATVARTSAVAAGIEMPPRAVTVPNEKMPEVVPTPKLETGPRVPRSEMAEMLESMANPLQSRADRVWNGTEKAILAQPTEASPVAPTPSAGGEAALATQRIPTVQRDLELVPTDLASGTFELKVKVAEVTHQVRGRYGTLFGLRNGYSHTRVGEKVADATVQFLNPDGSGPTAEQIATLQQHLARPAADPVRKNPVSRVAAAAEAAGLLLAITGIEGLEARSLSHKGSTLVARNLLVRAGTAPGEGVSINQGEMYGADLRGLVTQGAVSINQVDARNANISGATISKDTSINRTDLRGAAMTGLKLEVIGPDGNLMKVSADEALSGKLGKELKAIVEERLLKLLAGSIIDKRTKFDPRVEEFIRKNSTPVRSVGEALYGDLTPAAVPNANQEMVINPGALLDEELETAKKRTAEIEDLPWFRRERRVGT